MAKAKKKGRDPAAVRLANLRAQKLTPERRSEIARNAGKIGGKIGGRGRKKKTAETP